MPNWADILNEVRSNGHTTDVIRRKYLKKLNQVTKRNVIIYYSGWLQKKAPPGGAPLDFGINDVDKNGFMSVVYKLDRNVGLDLLLHTPGGDCPQRNPSSIRCGRCSVATCAPSFRRLLCQAGQ
jgi:hypothetical protein